MSFSCSNLSSPSFVRGALHASSSSKKHKTKAAFAVRAAEDGTYFIKPIHYAHFFDDARAKARRTKKVAMSASKNEGIARKRVFRARRRRRERRAEVASMGFLRVCENDFLYLSRRGEKTSKEDNLLWYRGRKKEGPPPAPEKKDLFIRSTRRGGAVYLFSERIQ